MAARYRLDDVRRCVDDYLNGDEEAIEFNSPSRSYLRVCEVFQCDKDIAVEKICEGLKLLSEVDYAAEALLGTANDPEYHDVYGLENWQGHNWYVKFEVFVDGNGFPCLNNPSFHPCEKSLSLKDGRQLKVTWEPEE